MSLFVVASSVCVCFFFLFCVFFVVLVRCLREWLPVAKYMRNLFLFFVLRCQCILFVALSVPFLYATCASFP